MAPMIPSSLAAGQVFHGRYEIVRCLKAGGMGAVYECIHLKTRKHRALKVMLPEIVSSASMRERFELEARVTAEIESEHIVETFDAGVDEETGAPYLVMELLRGEELGSLLKRRGALPFDEVVLLLSQTARALDRTHAAGIVHRDLKPDNFFVTSRDDGSPRLKILDFGVAKVVADETRTIQQTAAIGTPLYMSPEQFQGDGTIGPRADLYALGHIAYALLTGRPYWYDEQRSSPAVFAFFVLVMNGPSESPTARAARRGVALPDAFDAWFARATARLPRERFDRASTLVAELAAVLSVVPPSLSLATPAPRVASSPEIHAPPTQFVTLGVMPTQQNTHDPRDADKGPRNALTVVEPAPVGNKERHEVITGPDTAPDSTTPLPQTKRTGLRMLFIVPVSALVLWIGVMVMIRVLRANTVVEAPMLAASSAIDAGDSGAAAVPALPPASSNIPSATPLSVTVSKHSGSTVNIDSLPTVVSSSRPSVEKPLKPIETPKATVPTEAPKDKCNPPYTVDDLGHHHAKPQCL